MKIQNLSVKLLVCAAFMVSVIILYASGIGCMWRYFFGIRCLGCGMTSAYLALMRFDIRAAFRCHPMFWSVPIILWYILFDGNPLKNKLINNALIACIGAGFLISYIVNMILF